MEAFEALLADCGVRGDTLLDCEREALDQAGFVVLREVLSPARRSVLCAALERAGGDAAGPETGTRHLAGLLACDPAFDAVLCEARVLAAVRHVLGRAFRVLLFSARDPQPGYGQQGLHTDWLPRSSADDYSVVTALWMLDEFTADNGATRVLPGSQRLVRPLDKASCAPQAVHPAEQLVLAPAGSVLVLNGHLWHSGTRNRSRGPRRALQIQFVARDRWSPGQRGVEAPARLGARERALLGEGPGA